MPKYTRPDYKTNEDILSKLKINSVLKKIKNYRDEWVQHVRRMYRSRRAHFNCEISTVWDSKPRTTPQKTSKPFMGAVQITRPNSLMMIMMMNLIFSFFSI
jgi:hypothetical protein